ncbi:MAG: thermonuclease family protein [Actinobacteria bacterium]|nr:thermonuclease family protein [Actinomycetota bacterium]
MVPAAFVVALTACSNAPEPVDGVLEANAVIDRIVDGDTVVVHLGENSEKVRLIGIDTPESVDPRQPVECFGKEASARLAELLPPKTSVRLEVDAEPRDAYNRLLAYVHRASDGAFINLAMVADGYANTLSIPPNVTYRTQFAEAERSARDAQLGLWRACPVEPGSGR